MDIGSFVKSVESQFKKKYKDSDTEFITADEIKPVTGLIVDNPQLEYILDRRFLPFGRFYLSYGKKGSSKTSLFFDLAKLFQKHNGLVIWIETENAADKDYAAKQGVDLKRMYLQHPGSLEEALTLAESYIRRLPVEDPEGQTPVLICLDSIAGSTTEYELDQSHTIHDMTPGSHARILSRFYREMEKPLANEKCVFLALNQLKTNIGGFGFSEDAKDAMMGGEAPRFSSTYQLKMSLVEQLMAPDEHGVDRKVGSRHKIQCKRNKLGREGKGQEIEFDNYIYGGIDWYSPLVRRLGKEYTDIISKEHGGYSWRLPDTKYVDVSTGEEFTIDTDKTYKEHELARILMNSTQAKEEIRKAFKIPDLPNEAEIQDVEKARLTKRKKKKALADDPQPVKASLE
jgi:RecA/RadA recombinase